MLTFDEIKHEYKWDGSVVPGVTSIIKPLTEKSLAMIPADTLEKARQEGVAVHKMVELYCKDDLAEIPEWMTPYLTAWTKFVAESGFKFVSSEKQVFNKIGYAGTLDLAGTMGKAKKSAMAIVDIKRSFLAGAAIGVQLAAYQKAWNHGDNERAKLRFALKLQNNGEYRLREFSDATDYSVFMAHLIIHKHKEKYHEQYGK